MRYGCIRYFASFRFLSSSLDYLVKTHVDNKHRTLENLVEKTTFEADNICEINHSRSNDVLNIKYEVET